MLARFSWLRSSEATHDAERPAQPWIAGRGPHELDGCPLGDLGEGRVGKHQAGKVLHLEPPAEGEAPRHDKFARVSAGDRATPDPAAAVDDRLHVTLRRPFGLGAI